MNFSELRKKSFRKVKTLGFDVNHNLPLLDSCIDLREENEIILRSLSLFSIVASAYGYRKDLSKKWLKKEGLYTSLSHMEVDFLSSDKSTVYFEKQVEALYVFAWVFSFESFLDFENVCPKTLIKVFPDIKNGESINAYKLKTELRSLEEVVASCDLAYCLHWSLVDARLNGKPCMNISEDVIRERRRALEWIVGQEDWDSISLDT